MGGLIPGAVADVPFRATGGRVVDVDAFSGAVRQGLVDAGGLAPDAPWTPAEFALELVEGVQEVDFAVTPVLGGGPS